MADEEDDDDDAKFAKIWEGSELVPGGGDQLGPPPAKTCKNLGGVRAGPRRRGSAPTTPSKNL